MKPVADRTVEARNERKRGSGPTPETVLRSIGEMSRAGLIAALLAAPWAAPIDAQFLCMNTNLGWLPGPNTAEDPGLCNPASARCEEPEPGPPSYALVNAACDPSTTACSMRADIPTEFPGNRLNSHGSLVTYAAVSSTTKQGGLLEPVAQGAFRSAKTPAPRESRSRPPATIPRMPGTGCASEPAWEPGIASSTRMSSSISTPPRAALGHPSSAAVKATRRQPGPAASARAAVRLPSVAEGRPRPSGPARRSAEGSSWVPSGQPTPWRGPGQQG